MTTSTTSSLLAVLGLVLVLAPAPSSLALHVDVKHVQHHHHPVNLTQWSNRAPGDVRCYCNLPVCITTGYMCKSAGRGCFSDLVDHVDVYRARHGCLDLLDGDRQRQCKNQPRPDPELVDDVPAWERTDTSSPASSTRDAVTVQDADDDDAVAAVAAVAAQSTKSSPSLLLCCTEDMCNHIDSPRHSDPSEVGASHVSMSSPAGSAMGAPGAAEVPSSHVAATGKAGIADARSADMWFKAATIAVPICGALILVLLIVLAVRLLRADSQHQRASKLSACAFPTLSDKKVPLLACAQGLGQGHGQGVNRLDYQPQPSKNHALAKLNYSASYDLLALHKEASSDNHRNMFLAPASKYSYKQVLASFVPWTGPVADPPAYPPASV